MNTNVWKANRCGSGTSNKHLTQRIQKSFQALGSDCTLAEVCGCGGFFLFVCLLACFFWYYFAFFLVCSSLWRITYWVVVVVVFLNKLLQMEILVEILGGVTMVFRTFESPLFWGYDQISGKIAVCRYYSVYPYSKMMIKTLPSNVVHFRLCFILPDKCFWCWYDTT